ncbi:MAG: hypothetical protein Q9171_003284 [Xanthocarpia ochracea]
MVSSILVSITDTKYLFHIQLVPHLARYRQFWRLLIWQSCYNNSGELLFAVMTLYNLRVIERLWGSRKFAVRTMCPKGVLAVCWMLDTDSYQQSFLMAILIPTLFIPPILLALLRPITFSTLNVLPAGPTPLIFALLAQYHATIPTIYKYRLLLSSSSMDALTLSDKSLVYLVAAQLALSSLPGSLISAAAGWFVGVAWRRDLGPEIWTTWRIPAWIIGDKQGRGGDFERFRRRMEGEGRGTGSTADDNEGEARQRGLGRGIVDQFRGAS